ncbi:dihydrofolate reductase family protein [Lysobacter silvisoli]|uniref:Dihydrofolate reductase n=1 Tax=Lysobacter silvisoli TaxID=2293254 RepID=A0A371JXU4_9GAMM|nr:dihydrofolate reductase family protein [Lysobacter silvisoli]RDZ26488.1 dihydrofolate reductase [Lysobacter silvisoli]
MKTVYYTSSSLDGFLATESDSLDWLFPLGDIAQTSYPAFIESVGAIAMGSSTYEWILRNAGAVSEQTGSAWPYLQPTWVFTTRELPRIDGAQVTFAQGDVRAAHRDMQAAADGKTIWIMGGGDLAGQFHDAGLLDEIVVQIGSATLGRGKPLFPRQVLGPGLSLVSVNQVGSGFAELSYRVSKDAR